MIVCLYKFAEVFNLDIFIAIQTFLVNFSWMELIHCSYSYIRVCQFAKCMILGDVTHGRVLRQKWGGVNHIFLHGSKKIRVRAMVSRPSWRKKILKMQIFHSLQIDTCTDYDWIKWFCIYHIRLSFTKLSSFFIPTFLIISYKK